MADAIDQSVFPGIQGGPQNHTIAGLAVALKEANTEEFKEYQRRVQENARALAKALMSFKYTIRTGGTDNHMVIWDFRPLKMESVFFEKACNFASVTLNPIRIAGSAETNAVRVGSMACTSRGYTTSNMSDVALYLHQILQRTTDIKEKTHHRLADFIMAVKEDPEMKSLKAEIEHYAEGFPIPGL